MEYFEDILLLFAVGIGFAAAYKLSGNNLIVAYFVNLPNAFVTYMLKFKQFPKMAMHRYIVRNCRGIYCPCESEYKRKVKTTLIDEWKLIPII